MISGNVTNTLAAIINPHGSSCCVAPLNKAIDTGTVRALFVRVNVKANRNSFHAEINASKPVVTIDGIMIGIKTLKRIESFPAPSIIAASSNSVGIVFKKLVNTHTVNGIHIIIYDTINAVLVLYKLKIFINSNIPDKTATCGSVEQLNIANNVTFLPLNFPLANGYAASNDTTKDITDVHVATIAEFIKEYPNVESLHISM